MIRKIDPRLLEKYPNGFTHRMSSRDLAQKLELIHQLFADEFYVPLWIQQLESTLRRRDKTDGPRDVVFTVGQAIEYLNFLDTLYRLLEERFGLTLPFALYHIELTWLHMDLNPNADAYDGVYDCFKHGRNVYQSEEDKADFERWKQEHPLPFEI